MKFVKEIPVDNFPFEGNDKWVKSTPLKGISTQMVIGIIIGIIMMECLELCLKKFVLGNTYDFVLYKKVYIFLMAIPIHELIHLLGFPKPSKAIVGIVLKKGLFFVSLTSLTTGCRLTLIYLLPFIVLTIIPIVVLLYIPNFFLADLVLCNAVGSGLDLMYAWIIFFNPYPLKSIYSTNDKYLFVYKKSIPN